MDTETQVLEKEQVQEAEFKKAERPPEYEMLKHMFENTVSFFRLINKTMIALGYSRQKRRQVFEAIVKKSSLDSEDVIKGLMEELKPILEEAQAKSRPVNV